MDLVTPRQEQRLAALERVAAAPRVEGLDLRRELGGFVLLLLLLVASVGTAIGALLGILWLLG